MITPAPWEPNHTSSSIRCWATLSRLLDASRGTAAIVIASRCSAVVPITTLGPIQQFRPTEQGASKTAKGPTIVPSPISTAGATIAVLWIATLSAITLPIPPGHTVSDHARVRTPNAAARSESCDP